MEERFETCRNPTKPSQKENLLCLKLPLKTPSPIHVALYFCLRLILVFNFWNFQKKVLFLHLKIMHRNPKEVDPMWPGIGPKEVQPYPGLLVPLVPLALASGPRSPGMAENVAR